MAKDRPDQVNDQRHQLEKSNFSHLMITSANTPDSYVEARDGTNSIMFWDNHPDYKSGVMHIQDTSSTTMTGPAAANMNQYATDKAWAKTGGMSFDGLFVPYSANFEIKSDSGSAKDKNKSTPGSALPTFERPYSTVDKEGKISDKVEWSGSGKTEGLGVNAPAPDFITSVSLNPVASGHYIKAVNKNQEITHPHLDAGGYAKHSSNLVDGKTDSTETARPIGLRGPLVMAGWGYDIYEKPVPNLRFDADHRHDEPTAANYG